MDVLSVSPFRVGSVLWRSRPDRWTLTVVCKGTYVLAPGEATLAAEQDEVNERDDHWDDDPRRSVHAPSDLAPFKPRADVMLVGHAFAPRSEAVRSLVARLQVGEVEKAVEVMSPRLWTQSGELREGARWNKMPLRWENAAGGPGTWNPVGMSRSAPPDAYGQRLLPNLQPPGLRAQHWGDLFVPVGFGPIGPRWAIRRDKLGPRKEGWSDEGWTQIPLDDDFDGEFFQAAPPDQQLDTLHDDAEIVLEYLHPEHPHLSTRLPGLHPHAFVDVPGSAPRDLVMTADTLWIDTDRGVCTVTWRGQVAVDGPDQPGRVVIAMEEPGHRLTWVLVAQTSGLAPGGTLPPLDSLTPAHGRPPLATLPFQLADSARGFPPSPAHAVEAPAPANGPETPRAGGKGRQTTLQMTASGTADTPVNHGWPPIATEVPPPPAGIRRTAPPEVRVPPPADKAIEVVWVSHALNGRLRTHPSWSRLFAAANTKAMRTTMVSASLIDSADDPNVEADAAAILSRAKLGDVDLEIALFDSISDGGALVPELILLSGEIELPFDEVEAMKLLIEAAAPLARGDARLAETLELATAMARTPLQHAPDVAAALGESVRDAWSQANRTLPPEHLDAQVSRALLSRRAYQRRDLFGETVVRALFTPAGAPQPIPAYVPEDAARRLPLFSRFPARILAELWAQQDQHEESAVSLRALAIARTLTRARR